MRYGTCSEFVVKVVSWGGGGGKMPPPPNLAILSQMKVKLDRDILWVEMSTN